MLRSVLLAFAAAAALIAPAYGQNANEQNFIDLQTALLIDDKCHFLRDFEREHSNIIEHELLRPLWFFSAFESGTITRDEYDANYAKLADMARARAGTITCTDSQAAAPFILGLRDQVSSLLYAELMIAFESDKITEELRNAGRAYEAMIAPLYGENWPAFTEHARNIAQFKIDEARRADAAANPFGSLERLAEDVCYDGADDEDYYCSSGASDLWTSSIYLDAMVEGTIRVPEALLFELVADRAGYRLRTERSADGASHVKTLAGADGARIFDLWQAPASFPTIEKAGPVYLAFLIKVDDGTIRLMSYGEQASRLDKGSITLWVNPEQLATNQRTDYTYMRSQEWRDAARIFKAERVDEACLGGPCFALPAEVIDTILSGAPEQAFRFFLSTEADPEMPDRDNYDIETGFTYALGVRQAFLASASQ